MHTRSDTWLVGVQPSISCTPAQCCSLVHDLHWSHVDHNSTNTIHVEPSNLKMMYTLLLSPTTRVSVLPCCIYTLPLLTFHFPSVTSTWYWCSFDLILDLLVCNLLSLVHDLNAAVSSVIDTDSMLMMICTILRIKISHPKIWYTLFDRSND